MTARRVQARMKPTRMATIGQVRFLPKGEQCYDEEGNSTLKVITIFMIAKKIKKRETKIFFKKFSDFSNHIIEVLFPLFSDYKDIIFIIEKVLVLSVCFLEFILIFLKAV